MIIRVRVPLKGGVMVVDSFFEETDLALLLLLFLTNPDKAENEAIEEGLEEELVESTSEPEQNKEEVCCIYRSSNRKRLKSRAVYF